LEKETAETAGNGAYLLPLDFISSNAYERLENSAQASSTGSDMIGHSSPNAVGPKPETHTEQARDELRLLIKIIDTHLSRQINLHVGLNHEAGKVRFRDLWHIFKPGYEIRSHGASQIQL